MSARRKGLDDRGTTHVGTGRRRLVPPALGERQMLPVHTKVMR